tara:strand:+ start:284 stop:499 length:216 start_codon:yes stop_codon:yes gene_type:complete
LEKKKVVKKKTLLKKRERDKTTTFARENGGGGRERQKRWLHIALWRRKGGLLVGDSTTRVFSRSSIGIVQE